MTFLQLTYHLESFRKGGLYWFVPECGEYIRIFEYWNIFVKNIYSEIRSCQICFYEYIRTLVHECIRV